MEKFEDFLKGIPEGVAKPLESEEEGAEREQDPVKEGQEILDALDVIKRDQADLLPRIDETIEALRVRQNKNIREPDESVRNILMRLIAEREKIEGANRTIH